MISYLVATIPWTFGCLALSPPNPRAIKLRKYLAGAFFGTLIPLIYFFIQHKVHRVAGGKREAPFGPIGIIVDSFFLPWQLTRRTPSSSGPSFSSTLGSTQ
jgi:hypothetical protein